MDYHRELNHCLKQCIFHHLLILDCCAEMETYFSPVIFIKSLQITSQICNLMYISTKVRTYRSNKTVHERRILHSLKLPPPFSDHGRIFCQHGENRLFIFNAERTVYIRLCGQLAEAAKCSHYRRMPSMPVVFVRRTISTQFDYANGEYIATGGVDGRTVFRIGL